MSALRRVPVLLALGIVAASLLLTSCAPAPPTLQGQLTDLLTGLNLTNVEVAAYSNGSQTLAALTVSDSSGQYSFAASALPAGSYRLRFSDTDWWQGANSWATATTVVLPSGATTTINEGLVPARGSISGTVLDGSVVSAVPLPGAGAAAVSTVTGNTVATVATDAFGSYQLPNLPVGTYRVRFAAAGDAVRFNGSANAPSAAPIVAVTANTVSTGVGATLRPASSISGRVTNGRDPVAARVTAYDASSGDQITGVSAGADGRFTLAGLNSTGFHLVVTDPSGALRTSAWGSTSPDPATGATFTPAVGATLDAGTQAMTGKDCDPAVFHPGAANSGLHLANANLTDCDLSGEALVGADLHGASVQYANLAGSDLTNADLAGVSLSGANSTGTVLAGANLTGASLIGTTISGAQLAGATLTGIRTAVLGGLPATLPTGWQVVRGYLVGPGAGLVGADLRGANLANLDLHGIDLGGAQLAGADLTCSNLTGARLAGAVLDGTSLACSTVTGLRTGVVSGTPASLPSGWQVADPLAASILIGPTADLKGTTLANLDVVGIDLTGIDLTGATISSWHLNGVTLTGAKFGGATIDGINTEAIVGTPASIPSGWRFVGGGLIGPNAFLGGSPNLAGIDLHGLDLHGFGADGSNLSGANLSGTNLAASLFTDVNLTGANFGAGTLDGATFQGTTNLTNAVFAGANLHGAAFYADTVLQGADLHGADLSNGRLLPLDLDHVNLAGTDLSGDWFTIGATFVGSNLTGATVTGSGIGGADLSQATLTNLTSGGVTFIGPGLPAGWTLVGGYFVGPTANLRGAAITNVDLAGVSLAGADLRGATLGDVTGNPVGGSTAVYLNTRCPDHTLVSTPATCVGHGLAP